MEKSKITLIDVWSDNKGKKYVASSVLNFMLRSMAEPREGLRVCSDL